MEDGKASLEGVLMKRGDNIAFLEAFTRAEDDLLDWAEDVREVEFFFQSQKKIFDGAWRLCANVHRDRYYFMDEPDALAAAETMKEILKSAKPYRRIVELPTLEQNVKAAYDRINEARRERIEETIIQARGDIHTLAGDYPDLRGEIQKADEELERRREEAQRANSPTQLDAGITQIITYSDGVCRRLEKMIANKNNAYVPKNDIVSLRRYDIMPQKRLANEAEVNEYVEELRCKLMDALKDHDAIQLN